MIRPLLVALVVLVLQWAPANAVVFCPEGRTLAGECVNPQLAQQARQRAVVFSQIQLSKTSPIYPPSDDRRYLIPYNVFEMLKVMIRP